jgi:hypothetical protein
VILNRYHAGQDTDADVSPLVRYELAEIESAIEMEKLQNTRSYLDFFSTSKSKSLDIISSLRLMLIINQRATDGGLRLL